MLLLECAHTHSWRVWKRLLKTHPHPLPSPPQPSPSPLHYSCLLTLLLLLRSAFSPGNPPERRVICSSFGLESLSSLNSQMKIKISGPGSMHFERIKLSFFLRTYCTRSISRKFFVSKKLSPSPLSSAFAFAPQGVSPKKGRKKLVSNRVRTQEEGR